MTEPTLPVSSPPDPLIDRLVAGILSEIRQRYGLDLSKDPVAMQRIRSAAENAKRDLSLHPQTEIDLPFISANQTGPIHYKRVVSREQFGPAPDTPGSDAGEAARGSGTPLKVQLKLPDTKPVVTITLMVIMAIIFSLQLLTTALYSKDLPAALGMKINEAIVGGEYWRLVTPMFLHGGILHLGFNLYALYVLGRQVESLFGHWRFLGLFLLSGISGNLLSFLFTSSPSLGSSTAIFGLLAADGVFIYQHKQLYGKRFGAAMRQIIQVAVINLLIGLSPLIDNWGHIGGLLGGLAFTWFGGPSYEVRGAPPVLELHDRRPKGVSGLIFVVQLILLAGLAAWIILSRR